MDTAFASEQFPASSGAQLRLLRLADLLGEWEAEAVAAHEALRTGQPRGAVTGLPRLDQELGGALAHGLHVVHGGPGVGKTALALQIAASCRCPAIYVTCEMGVLELFRRLVARVTNTFLGRLKSGELEPVASTTLARQAVVAAPSLALVDATQAFASPDWLSQAVIAVRRESPHALVVIDSIHSWAESGPIEVSEYEGLNFGLNALRHLTTRVHCAVIGVAERNRGSMANGGLSASAGSRKFEYGGETVWDLSRREDAVLDAAGEVPVTLNIVKNRNGSPNRKVELLFHGALQRWREAGRQP
jgi:replicative DNA helicase